MAFDWLVLKRVINRGYPPSHVTDYLDFLFPLLCIGAVWEIAQRYGAAVGKAPHALGIGLACTAAFQFSEAYLTHSGIPFGLVFFLTGHLLMLAGLLFVGRRIRNRGLLFWSLLALFISIVSVCASPFFTQSLPIELATAVTVSLMAAVGMLWAVVGAALIVDVS